MVTTSHPLAAQAGLEILQKGGNAIDAAVAGLATLDVVSPNDTGIGGDVFVLYWSASDRKLHSLSSAGWSPESWTTDYFRDRKPEGVNSVTVPGAVAGFDAMLKRCGTMTFKETFERAATIAEQGWGMSERHHRDLVHNLMLYARIRNPRVSSSAMVMYRHFTASSEIPTWPGPCGCCRRTGVTVSTKARWLTRSLPA
ncbi:gamma-glutamyltransferase [Mesorhizobium sp. UC22_110]|uniref:gamma-glutamyltransferase n=1 Tax=Mesorhizobium sp. UC22_110 TaxID=3374552 RepID=UPI003756FE98